MAALEELGSVYSSARSDPVFQAELRHHLAEFAGRPTPLYYAERLTRHCGGAKIYLKREDLLHTCLLYTSAVVVICIALMVDPLAGGVTTTGLKLQLEARGIPCLLYTSRCV